VSADVKERSPPIQYARVNKLPFFGICLGMQAATIEFARNVCGLKNAQSREFSMNAKQPVIDYLADQRTVKTRAQQCDWAAIPVSDARIAGA